MESTTPEFKSVAEGPGEWTHLEIFGHRTHDGRLSEVERFGTKMARIEVFCRDGHLMFVADYGGASIFSSTPIPGGEQAARKATGVYGCTDASHADEKKGRYSLPAHSDDESSDEPEDDLPWE